MIFFFFIAKCYDEYLMSRHLTAKGKYNYEYSMFRFYTRFFILSNINQANVD